MHLSWRERLEQRPALRDLREWPVISIDEMARGRRRAFVRNQQIAARALAGEQLQSVAAELGVSAGYVTQLLDRCLAGEDSEAPALSAGLVPYQLTATKKREKALPSLEKPSGVACTFTALLEQAPAISEGLDAMIRAALEDRPYSQRLTPKAMHGEFKRLLAEIDWPTDRYPYTSPSRAYDSVRRYCARRRAQFEREHLQRRAVVRTESSALPRQEPALRTIQIDEHLLDLPTRLHLRLNDTTIPLRLARASVLVAVDRATHCVLGYHLALTRHPTQEDLLTLIDRCIQPGPLPPLTTPGMSYAPQAGFPCTLDDAPPVTFGQVQLDNALMHSAHSVLDLLIEQLDAVVHFGPPATPTVRSCIESVFGYLARAGTHRTAATSGTGPGDPRRESRANHKGVPVITIQSLNDALAVLLTEYNVTPQDSLHHASPLAVCRQHMLGGAYLSYTHPLRARQWRPLISSRECALHWYRNEHRQPHVNFGGVRYSGPGLAQVAGRERSIRVDFDRRDIRTLRASTLAGRDLGTLEVARHWRQCPHSLALRQCIQKMTRTHRLAARDPLASYFHYLLEHRGEPANDLQLARVYTAYTYDGVIPELSFDDSGQPSPVAPEDFDWTPAMAAQLESP